METLTGPILKNMVFESFERIKSKVELLNDINVFPVPDGDTGLNIRITMGKVVEELEKTDSNVSIKEAAKSIAKGAFIGAKGNSGVILSQFFVGFAKAIENESDISTSVFAKALIEGSNRAYKAVMNPREGTILTVCKETAEAALIKAEEGGSWKEIVEHCYNIAQKSTMDTPNLLKDLKDAGVVDAGALGFVYLIQGWLFVIASNFDGPKVIDVKQELSDLHNSVDASIVAKDLTYRFCTEGLIVLANKPRDQVQTSLESYGDSFLLIEDEKSMKLHVHSNEPSRVISEFAKFGQLQTAKIDDMKAQTLRSHGK